MATDTKTGAAERYRVETDTKAGFITIWDDCAGVGLRFRTDETLARYNSELLAGEEYTRTQAGLDRLVIARNGLIEEAARRYPLQFDEIKTK